MTERACATDVQNVNMFHVEQLTAAHYLEAVQGMQQRVLAEQAAEEYTSRGPGWAAFVDGHLAGVGGVLILWPGVGEAWAVLTDVGRAHPIPVVRTMIRRLRQVIVDYRLRRVQADMVEGHFPARKLGLYLGFKDEHRMALYGPAGEDFIRGAMFPALSESKSFQDGVWHVQRGTQEYIQAEDGHLLPVIAGGYGSEIAGIAAIVGATAAVAGTAVSVYSSYAQGQAASQAAKYNAQFAENQAISARQSAEAEAQQKAIQYRRIMAANRAAVGGSNLETDKGSPLMVSVDNATQAALDEQLTRYGGELRATGYKSEAGLYSAGSASSLAAAKVGMANTLLSGAANLGQRAYKTYATYNGATTATPASGYSLGVDTSLSY